MKQQWKWERAEFYKSAHINTGWQKKETKKMKRRKNIYKTAHGKHNKNQTELSIMKQGEILLVERKTDRERARKRRELAKRCERTEFFVRRCLIHLIAYIFHFFSTHQVCNGMALSLLLTRLLYVFLHFTHTFTSNAQAQQPNIHSQFFGSNNMKNDETATLTYLFVWTVGTLYTFFYRLQLYAYSLVKKRHETFVTTEG